VKDYAQLLDLFLKHLDLYRSGVGSKKPKELYGPEDYILSLGGKRLRPLLALIACDLFEKDPKLALDAALCVELFHNFSLIHDDILDAAPLRRNQPTVHVKWNTSIAILSGDVMLVKAYQALESYGLKEFKKLTALFNKTAIEVCEGQQLDMNFESASEVTVDEYLDMITRKTAVLLGCSLQLGAINAYASEEDQKNLYEFGKHLGVAFQLLDDLLDAFAEHPEKFGKQAGGDILANKKTFLLLKALELASGEQKKEIQNLLESTDVPPEKKIKDMLAIFTALDVKNLCLAEADKHTALAIACLNKLTVPEKKLNTLRNFALDLLNRQI
jgi:geranylgeranyl diphosphate synthase, type II